MGGMVRDDGNGAVAVTLTRADEGFHRPFAAGRSHVVKADTVALGTGVQVAAHGRVRRDRGAG